MGVGYVEIDKDYGVLPAGIVAGCLWCCRRSGQSSPNKAPQVKAVASDETTIIVGKQRSGCSLAIEPLAVPPTNSGLIIRSAGEDSESDPDTLAVAQLSSMSAPSIDKLLEDQAETELPEDSVEAEVDETDALSAPSADLAEDADGGTEDIVGNIIWNLETAQKNKPEPLPEPEIPLGQDPSLASEALEAAFAMLAGRQAVPAPTGFSLPPKISRRDTYCSSGTPFGKQCRSGG